MTTRRTTRKKQKEAAAEIVSTGMEFYDALFKKDQEKKNEILALNQDLDAKQDEIAAVKKQQKEREKLYATTKQSLTAQIGNHKSEAQFERRRRGDSETKYKMLQTLWSSWFFRSFAQETATRSAF